jgi:P-type Ca2+ transporter type 2C
MPTETVDRAERPPYARDSAELLASLGSDAVAGLTAAEAATRLGRYGPNEIAREPPPSPWAIALQQLRDPMNIMLIAVVAVSFAIGEVSTGAIVALLILLNVVLGSRQELAAQASIDALSSMQVPQAKVVRDGGLALVPAAELVPGDVVQVEAGDIVPADGRVLQAATVETQEARARRFRRTPPRSGAPTCRSATARTCSSRTRP